MFLGLPGPGFGSVSQRYGAGSGSFYNQAKIVRKTLISTVLLLLFYLSLKNYVDVPSMKNDLISSKSNRRETLKIFFFLLLLAS
jgi:hypothetical protein